MPHSSACLRSAVQGMWCCASRAAEAPTLGWGCDGVRVDAQRKQVALPLGHLGGGGCDLHRRGREEPDGLQGDTYQGAVQGSLWCVWTWHSSRCHRGAQGSSQGRAGAPCRRWCRSWRPRPGWTPCRPSSVWASGACSRVAQIGARRCSDDLATPRAGIGATAAYLASKAGSGAGLLPASLGQLCASSEHAVRIAKRGEQGQQPASQAGLSSAAEQASLAQPWHASAARRVTSRRRITSASRP